MNEEIDETALYHQDFTTASEWEVFVARIEEVLHDWRLGRSRQSSPPECGNSDGCVSKSEDVHFYGSLYTLSYHNLEPAEDTKKKDEIGTKSDDQKLSARLFKDLWESGNHFMDQSECSFPVASWYGLKQFVLLGPHTPLTDESQIKLILSSVNIAIANVLCMVPIFVKVREHWQHCYRGIFEDNDYRTSFDTIHLKRIPSQCYHLSGLLNLLKGKVSSPTPIEPVHMSAKFSYNLKDVEAFKWRRPHSDEFFLDEEEFKKWIELPCGSIQNPIKSLNLNVVWPKFLEDAVIDSPSYSDFDPLMAPIWAYSVEEEENLTCLLTETINKMINLLSNDDLMMNMLGLSKTLGIINPLHKITEPPNAISKLVKAAIGPTNKTDFKGPIPDEQLMPLLYYVFPDAVDHSPYNYPQHLKVEFNKTDGAARLCGHVKTGPELGLAWRVGAVSARLLDVGGLPYLAHLWYELTQELAYRWEHRVSVPGVAPGMPSARSCLLHQKLQLLNCCIERARATPASGDSSDEEFFDCSDSDEPSEVTKPVGRLSRLADAVMKNGEPLYTPKTQDPAPKTEDQLEEDAELMLRLGDDARASELRARMMSASLLSDMEAFKAANPGAQLCDFVRWYSPRDWLPDDGGTLGDRMLLPGNPWAEAWAVARAVPASRQRRLFDESREAERCLHFLRSRTVAGAAELLLPGALRAAAARLHALGAEARGRAAAGEGRRAWEHAARELAAAETTLARRKRAEQVLGDASPDGPLDAAGRTRLTSLLGGGLPQPSAREFVLRVRDHVAPQLLRARIASDMRIVAAFTEHIVL